ncbi:MAG: hypothetical protein Q9169_008393 [Polycauliona sp. 2 TL-2023]
MEVESDEISDTGVVLSRVWTKLPSELVCIVVERSDRRTLYDWSRTSKLYYNIAADIIWESFCVEGNTPNRTKHRIDALLCSLRHTKSPSQRVKDFDFMDMSDALNLTQRRKASRCMIDAVKLFPNLERVQLEGDVHPNAFHALMQNTRLQKLSLRAWIPILPFDQFALAEPHCSYTLNFALLAGMTSLQNLSIGRLTPSEAPGLGRALRNLPLIKLTLHAAPAADSEDPRRSYAGSEADKSPIQIMLETIQVDQGDLRGRLPLSLQSVILSDVYRSFKTTKEDLLLITLGPLNVLELHMFFTATKQLAPFFAKAIFPSLTTFALNGCRHLLADAIWETLGLEYDRSARLDPPEIPIAGIFLWFLGVHQKSLQRLTISPAMHDCRPQETRSLYFTQSDLAGLGRLGWEHSASRKLHNQTMWDEQSWIGTCTQRHIEDGTDYCPCLCTETEACITMWFIEQSNDMISYANEDEEESEDEDEEKSEDEDEEDEYYYQTMYASTYDDGQTSSSDSD